MLHYGYKLTDKNVRNSHTSRTGFTIIELLVVIVVIGILAGITILGYGAWKKATLTAQVKSDLNGVSAAMESARNFGTGYPTGVPSSITPSGNVVFSGGGSPDGTTYCVSGTTTDDGSITFHVGTDTKGRDPQPGGCSVVTTLAGSTLGYLDATGIAAQFRAPSALVLDSSGNIFAGDASNNRIRKITPAGVVTTFAGSTPGYADATGIAAQFGTIYGMTIDQATGTLYVMDATNYRLRKVTSAGVVTTIAGSTSGYADGTGAAAQFGLAFGVGIDSSGNLYVADYVNCRIRKVTQAGVVTTLAGSTCGVADGTGAAAQFSNPTDIVVDASGNLYVTDIGSYRIRKVTQAGVVTTIAGSSTPGFADGTGAAAQFGNLYGIGIDIAGNLYVTDAAFTRVRKVTQAGVVTTIAGSSTSGSADGIGSAAQFTLPFGIVITPSGTIYVSDFSTNRIRQIQ